MALHRTRNWIELAAAFLILMFGLLACDAVNMPPVPDNQNQSDDNSNSNGNDNSSDNSNDNDNQNDNSDSPPPEEPAFSLMGEWVVESGNLMTIAPNIEFPALVLNEDGTGRIVAQERSSVVHECLGTTYLIHEGELVVDLTPSGIPFGERYLIIQEENDSLALVSSSNLISLLSRRETLPEEVDCQTLQSVRRFDDLPQPGSFSNVAFHEGKLVYTYYDLGYKTATVDADSGATGDLTPPIQGNIQTAQGDGFWTHCACGGNEDATLYTTTQSLETLNTDTELGRKINIQGMAFDKVEQIIWLVGPAADNSGNKLLKAKFTAGTPALLDTTKIEYELSSIAWDGTQLWGVSRFIHGVVVKINPISGTIQDMLQVPEVDVSFSGITIDDGRMFLLGTDPDLKGVIVEVAIPE